ncbi:MAG: pyrimidine dimer DNA glycosylase/endonuclease V [Chloroflexi bacterium]|nr:pyrimidine dimer DNA glycosylase/endonuclease V [Chloroflexota bacterium]
MRQEALLAQKVVSSATRGYRNHPQLERFHAHPTPDRAIASYLHAVCEEATRRGYNIDRNWVHLPQLEVTPI